MNFINMGETQKCSLCNAVLDHVYQPMQDWSVKGLLCGKCYSKKLFEYYPGTHERVNKSN
ncbi:MAG: hypothetical protein AUI59_00755 [Thaumarchaeota archaeon 13_1_40CM_2_39_13_1]|nr:MAG: hypothetical protein AUI59_00755 [Thaumarchaeota archaeon 13_1_40CM_2_39_13_1]